MYLAVPFFARLRMTLSIRGEVVWIMLWFITASILPIFERVLSTKLTIPLGLFSSYYGYVWIGDLARRYRLTCSGKNYAMFGIGITVLTTLFGTIKLCVRDHGIFNENLLVFLSPNIVIFSVLAYLVISEYCHSYPLTCERLAINFGWIGSCSYGVYLCHVLVMEIVSDYLETLGFSKQSFGPLVLFSVTVVLSVGLVRLAGSFPLLRKLVG